MKATILLIFTIILTAMTIFSQTMPPIEAGVSQSLAKWRAANYSEVRYKLNITLEKGAPLMEGTIEISVKLTDEGAKNDLILDWRTTPFENDKDKSFADVVSVNTTTLGNASASGTFDYQTLKEHLLVSQRFLKAGENVIKINFASPIKTSGAGVTRYVDKEDGAEYVYSLFVPSDASTAFPVFDQPDLKARFQLNIDAPSKWKVVSNTLTSGMTVFGQTHEPNWQPHTITKFKETQPISTYVFAFAAGDFALFDDVENSPFKRLTILPGGDGELVDSSLPKIYVRKSQAEKFKLHAAETFRLNREAVKYLESYFDYKFPFPKYDLVLLPEFPFGGMEHAGATFLREDRVIFPTEPTKNDYITRANVIFHEAAHQWFGDTVTMKWFDDLWLKEGFAEFMAYKTLEKVMPEYNAWKIFYERNKQAAYLTDSTRGTTPIYQEIPNLSAAKSAYGNIVYRKAPSFLRQAEFYLGEDEFQTAVRAFLKKHEFANAEWADLVKEFETASKGFQKEDFANVGKGSQEKDLTNWGKGWVTKRGMPVVKLSEIREYEEGEYPIDAIKSLRVETKRDWYKSLGFEIKQKNILNEGGSWLMAFKMLVINESGQRQIADIKFTGDKEVDGVFVEGIKQHPLKWQFVFPNYQDYGYGIFLLDERSRAYVLANIQTEKDDFLRTMMWGALWDSVREGELSPKDYVELVIKNIAVESDESTIQTLLGRVSTAMNYYLPEPPAVAGGSSSTAANKNPSATADGFDLAAKLEAVLIDRMQSAPTLGQRITFYRAFLNVASTEKAKQTLKNVLSGKFQIKDLQLKTKDKFDIVTKLLILSDPDAPKLLVGFGKAETSDEAKRYAYAAKAGVAAAENKAKFWNDFTNNKDISESYIESAFGAFNSSKQSNLTLPYLEKALSELPNLKRSRKIFFVNGWLSAFIGGQKSAEALAIVNKFLADNPNLDQDLRLKILENADGLERAVKIRTKFAGR